MLWMHVVTVDFDSVILWLQVRHVVPSYWDEYCDHISNILTVHVHCILDKLSTHVGHNYCACILWLLILIVVTLHTFHDQLLLGTWPFESLISLWFIVNADLTITSEKLTELFSAVTYFKVDHVGVWLDLPQSKRDEIERNYHNLAQRIDAYIDAYVNDHYFPTWTQVARTLRIVNLRHQAVEVESTYVQGTITLYTHCLPSN